MNVEQLRVTFRTVLAWAGWNGYQQLLVVVGPSPTEREKLPGVYSACDLPLSHLRAGLAHFHHRYRYRYHPRVPAGPLNGPTISCVTQPP